MTPMPASPFMNSGAHVPEAPGSAAADQVAPQVAAAEPFHSSDGGSKDLDALIVPSPPRWQAIGEARNATDATESSPSETAAIDPCQEPVAASPISAASSDNLGCLTAEDEALYWQLRHADNPFTRDLPDVPDPQAFFDQIDPPPLFLQRQA